MIVAVMHTLPRSNRHILACIPIFCGTDLLHTRDDIFVPKLSRYQSKESVQLGTATGRPYFAEAIVRASPAECKQYEAY